MKRIIGRLLTLIGTIIIRVGNWLDYKVSYDMQCFGAKLIDRFRN